jgi:putative component of membrane protein insertase Oxa1/YidC/SpoIIIJ protein YidD
VFTANDKRTLVLQGYSKQGAVPFFLVGLYDEKISPYVIPYPVPAPTVAQYSFERIGNHCLLICTTLFLSISAFFTPFRKDISES